MRSYSLTALAAVFICGPAQAGEDSRPVDFRGAYLGMALEEFRALPFPERPDGTPRLICTGDQLPQARSTSLFLDFRTSRLTEITGVTSCAWFKAMNGGGVTTWLRSNLLAGGFPTEGQVFEFTSPEAGGTPVLFNISMQVRADGKQAVDEGLRSKFGQPTSDHRRGAAVNASLTQWVVGDQEITLSDTTMLRLSYTLRPLAETVEQRKRTAFGSPASGL